VHILLILWQSIANKTRSQEGIKESNVESNLGIAERKPEDLIEILQDIQANNGYLPEEQLKEVSNVLDVPLIEVFRVANFYKAFRLEPSGKYVITACSGTACHVRGSARIVEEALSKLQIELGATTVDRLFTVESVNCVGACALGPIIIVNGKYYDRMDPAKISDLIDSLSKEAGEKEDGK
jgi:NADH-quinone oxidoreductase subunit E